MVTAEHAQVMSLLSTQRKEQELPAAKQGQRLVAQREEVALQSQPWKRMAQDGPHAQNFSHLREGVYAKMKACRTCCHSSCSSQMLGAAGQQRARTGMPAFGIPHPRQPRRGIFPKTRSTSAPPCMVVHRQSGQLRVAPVLAAEAGAVGAALPGAVARRVAGPRLPDVVLHARRRHLKVQLQRASQLSQDPGVAA